METKEQRNFLTKVEMRNYLESCIKIKSILNDNMLVQAVSLPTTSSLGGRFKINLQIQIQIQIQAVSLLTTSTPGGHYKINLQIQIQIQIQAVSLLTTSSLGGRRRWSTPGTRSTLLRWGLKVLEWFEDSP